jgi:hypothetical protein
MKILLDQGAPAPLRQHLLPHTVDTVAERGWSTVSNGELLRLAEEDGYGVLITTDQNLRHQQNLSARRIGIIVLKSTSWPRILRVVADVLSAVERVAKGGFEEVEIP